jgi:hypothetical protein
MAALRLGSVRSRVDRALDAAVAQEVVGYRWVEWNHQALRGSPLERPGRFLALPDDPLAHLHVPASPGARQADEAMAHVPHYSVLADDALRAADVSGLFADGGAVVARGGDGWRVRTPDGAVDVSHPELPMALCQAALAWVRGTRSR